VVKNGHPLMSRVVGTGCMAAAVIGTFAAVEADLAVAAAAGLICFNVAAELAAELSPGPGSFMVKLFDCLDTLDEPTLADRRRVSG
jgi:hydroxyethylthiazole kinase